MIWKKQPLELSKLELVRKQLIDAVQQGNSQVENMRCVFMYENNPCYYMYTVFDFLDEYEKIATPSLKCIYLYQLINES